MRTGRSVWCLMTWALAGGVGCVVPGPGGSEAIPHATLSEELRIGSHDVPDQNLTAIGGVLPLDGGGVWVAQGSTREYLIYDEKGVLVRRVGGHGDGPGEFRTPVSFGWWDDARTQVWVADIFLRRVTLFSADGDHVDQFQVQNVEWGDSVIVANPQSFLADGTALASGTVRGSGNQRRVIVHYDPRSNVVYRAVARIERGPSVALPGLQGAVPRLFPDDELLAYSRNGENVVVVERDGVGSEPVGYLPVHLISTRGDTLWSKRYPYPTVLLTSAEIEAAVKGRADALARGQFGRLFSRPQIMESLHRLSPFPDHRPPVEDVFVTDDGRVWLRWVAPDDDDGARWWLLSTGGDVVAEVRTDRAFEILAARGDLLWVQERDAFHVPYLVRYRLDVP